MALSLNPRHIRRYGQIAALLARHGRSDLIREGGLESVLDEGFPAEVVPSDADEAPGSVDHAVDLAADLERMGPTFTKLGQLLSSRVDLLPPEYIEALSRLQEEVAPFPFAEAKEIVEEDLGWGLDRLFASFDEQPIAAASLGQVHRARLPSGREVAVKVQRPGVRDQMAEDLDVLLELAAFLDEHTEMGRRYHFAEAMAEMARALTQELDYQREAANLRTLGANLEEIDSLVVPSPVDEYVTSRVLTMDFVDGRKITELSPMAVQELDGEQLADDLFRGYLKQVLVDGFFHADPHPGNVYITLDGRIALIDVGMVGRLAPELQEAILRLLLAISEGRGRDAADIAIDLGRKGDDFDADRFREAVSRQILDLSGASAEDIQIGRVIMKLTRAAGECGLAIPAEFTLLGKTLLNIDLVGRTLDPSLQPNAAIQRHAAEVLQRRMLRAASPGNLFSGLLEANEFAQRLPGRLNRAFDALESREVEVRIRIANDAPLLAGLQKIANRIAAGAILAATIIAAAMMMQVDTDFRIFGYPGLAMLLFVIALVGAVWLFLGILMQDREPADGEDR